GVETPRWTSVNCSDGSTATGCNAAVGGGSAAANSTSSPLGGQLRYRGASPWPLSSSRDAATLRDGSTGFADPAPGNLAASCLIMPCESSSKGISVLPSVWLAVIVWSNERYNTRL